MAALEEAAEPVVQPSEMWGLERTPKEHCLEGLQKMKHWQAMLLQQPPQYWMSKNVAAEAGQHMRPRQWQAEVWPQ